MRELQTPTRRQALLAAGALALAGSAAQAVEKDKVFRIGVVSANIRGKPQPRNGHTWHFTQYLHPTIDFNALKKHYPPQFDSYQKYMRNPRLSFDVLPFPDTRITHYYDSDAKAAAAFAEVFPGVKVSGSVAEMIPEVDALWLGDASGYGDDHYDLAAPALEKGLPTFCDKPIGGSVAGTKKILELARKHKAPIMSSSLFRHEWGMEAALRLRDGGEAGPIRYLIASVQNTVTLDSWMVYGQHPAWTVMTLLGPGVEAVSMYGRENNFHALVTYKDRMPGEIWFGRPYYGTFEYNHTEVFFAKKGYAFTPSIEGSFSVGHHYRMLRMADVFRKMVRTREEPIPHQEILEVTAIVHAAAKSLQEKSRLVELAEVM